MGKTETSINSIGGSNAKQSDNIFKKAKKVDLFDPLSVIEFYKNSKRLKYTLAMEEDLKQKIMEFARKMEIDKNKDYDQERKRFHMSYNFKNEIKTKN